MRRSIVIICILTVLISGCLSISNNDKESKEINNIKETSKNYFENIDKKENNIKELVHSKSPNRNVLSFQEVEENKLNISYEISRVQVLFYTDKRAKADVNAKMNGEKKEITVRFRKNEGEWKIWNTDNINLISEKIDRRIKQKRTIYIEKPSYKINGTPQSVIRSYYSSINSLDKYERKEEALNSYIHEDSPIKESFNLNSFNRKDAERLIKSDLKIDKLEVIESQQGLRKIRVNSTATLVSESTKFSIEYYLAIEKDKWKIIATEGVNPIFVRR